MKVTPAKQPKKSTAKADQKQKDKEEKPKESLIDKLEGACDYFHVMEKENE